MSGPLHIPSKARDWSPTHGWSRLDDISEGVFDCPHTTPKLVAVGPYVARSQDVRGRVFDWRNAGRVSQDTYQERIARAEPRFGDLLYSREGTYFGMAAEVPQKMQVCLGQRMVLIRPEKDRLDHRFLLYWLNSPVMEGHLGGFRDGSVAERLNMATIRALAVPVPAIAEQRDIAATLGALDDKIELNRKTAATLEEMARALYRSWFVDFDPVRARVEGRAPAHMDPTTAALFPDSFREDGLPVGWRRGQLSDLTLLSPTAHSRKAHPSRLEYVDLANTKWGQIEATTCFDWDAAPSRARLILEVGDTIVGTVRPANGSYAYIGNDGLTGSTGFAVLRPRDAIDRALVYIAATDPATIEDLANLADGGAYPAVRPDVVSSRPVCLASKDIRIAFSEMTVPFIDKMGALKIENRTLAALRDTLLPSLMSGELRVGAAHEMIEEIA